MTIVGTLMILVALFTNRWLHGREHLVPRGTGQHQIKEFTSYWFVLWIRSRIRKDPEFEVRDPDPALDSELDLNFNKIIKKLAIQYR
jgi:hypothetical protein